MRTIKFRGQRVDNGEWVYGCLSYSKGVGLGAEYIDHAEIKSENETKDVWSETIGQFTGLTDAKENEIYEDDVVIPVKFKDVPNVVKYISHGFYRVKEHKGKPYLNVLGQCQIQVIGNIHDK
jgi:hypothetical protein